MPGRVAGALTALREAHALPPTADIADEVRRTGFAVLADAVSPEWIDAVREHAAELGAPGTHEVLLEDLTAADGDVIAALHADRRLGDVLASVARALHPNCPPDDSGIDVSLRVVTGPGDDDAPLWFHFDASVITIVFPIEIPDGTPGASGELTMYPNRRPYRRSVVTNIVEKMVMQSDRYRQRLDPADATVIPLVPGNAYAFSGYRSYHATLPCPAGSRRTTLMVHFQDAHAGSRLLNTSKSLYHKMIGG
jgi:hypothetical protein